LRVVVQQDHPIAMSTGYPIPLNDYSRGHWPHDPAERLFGYCTNGKTMNVAETNSHQEGMP
jgi:hypothetical protein